MPLINENLSQQKVQNNETFSTNQQTGFNQTAQANAFQTQKGLFQIPENLLRLIP
jgi:hypothetical protein